MLTLCQTEVCLDILFTHSKDEINGYLDKKELNLDAANNLITNVFIIPLTIFQPRSLVMGFQSSIFFLRIILASAVLSRVYSSKCGLDQVLTPTGKCTDCDFCQPGQGMDLKEEVK